MSPVFPPTRSPSIAPVSFPTNAPSFAPFRAPSTSPSSPPSPAPTNAPTLNPTALSDYKLHIQAGLAVVCNNEKTYTAFFTKNQYKLLAKKMEAIYESMGSNYLSFYHFYIQFTTIINDIYNISIVLPEQWINDSYLTIDDIREFYKYQINAQVFTVTVSFIVHAMLEVQTVFNDFFNNPVSRARTQV